MKTNVLRDMTPHSPMEVANVSLECTASIFRVYVWYGGIRLYANFCNYLSGHTVSHIRCHSAVDNELEGIWKDAAMAEYHVGLLYRHLLRGFEKNHENSAGMVLESGQHNRCKARLWTGCLCSQGSIPDRGNRLFSFFIQPPVLRVPGLFLRDKVAWIGYFPNKKQGCQ
jgi:hypothetical protein